MPIPKDNGKIRPIAISEVIYRFVTKVVVRHLDLLSSVLPNQFGVGTKGGVEPIISIVNSALQHEAIGHFTHLTTLDATNAFNTIDRSIIASSCAKHAPQLLKAAKWAYDNPASLILILDDGSTETIPSSQGVRQGDPLSAALFSIGIRPFLEALIAHLGPSHLVLAYLDDIVILSPDDTALTSTCQLLDSIDAPITLNVGKCTTTALEDIRQGGIDLMGTAIGGKTFRESHLARKVARVEEFLPRLAEVPHQHALILLRQALQHDLRHLLRAPRSADLGPTWKRLDAAIWKQVTRIRGGDYVDGPRAHLFDAISTLPTFMGGLGIPFHHHIASFASAAADASSRLTLKSLVPQTIIPTDISSQHDRCLKYYTLSRNITFTAMSMAERCSVLEAASMAGSAWLSVTPTRAADILSDPEVSTALQDRYGRQRPADTPCRLCLKQFHPAHGDVCSRNPMGVTTRHNMLTRALGRLAQSATGAVVSYEPPIEGSPLLRNDIRVTVLARSRLSAVDIDLSVVYLPTLLSAGDHQIPQVTRASLAATRASTAHTQLSVDTLSTIQARLLPRHAVKLAKVGRFPDYMAAHTFRPVVMSAGGVLEESASGLVKSWLAAASPWAKEHFWKDWSLILVRCRAPVHIK
jgi:hypothetical protein